MKVRLGVNIDHVATLRQARKTFEPDPVQAAYLAQVGGADQITVHLREDRRHIQDRDLRLLRETVSVPLNLEMALDQEILRIALQVKPERITLVPEKRQEVTTEGGLAVKALRPRIKTMLPRLGKAGIDVSLFIEPDAETVGCAADLGVLGVEFHTGKYAGTRGERTRGKELERLRAASRVAAEAGLQVYAGHGLTYHNVGLVAAIEEVEELNIGHSIMARAIWVGLTEAVRQMKVLLG